MTIPMLTNLKPTAGWASCPCVNLMSTEIPKSARWLMIDDGDRNDHAVYHEDSSAIARCDASIRRIADIAPNAMIGWYGWPPPFDTGDESDGVRKLIELADVVFPCCYATGDGKAPDRAVRVGDIIESFSVEPLYVAGVVTEFLLDSSRPCTDAEIREQLKAAKIVGCDSIYVWSGMPYRTWLMDIWRRYPVICNEPDSPQYAAVRRGRDELLNAYGFTGDPLDPKSCAAQAREYTRKLLARFAGAWKEMKK